MSVTRYVWKLLITPKALLVFDWHLFSLFFWQLFFSLVSLAPFRNGQNEGNVRAQARQVNNVPRGRPDEKGDVRNRAGRNLNIAVGALESNGVHGRGGIQ